MDHLNQFYASLSNFLLGNKLETSIKGFEKSEIENCEKNHSILFPEAYRLFLSRMAKTDLRIFDGQDFSISGLKDAHEVSNDLLKQDKTELPDEVFVFTQWQGYNFFYINLDAENPSVNLYIEAGCESENSPHQTLKQPRKNSALTLNLNDIK